MALGAGRKGLASELVDEFGHLKGEMPTGEYYTKSQTDNKFETKTHSNSTYQKKTLELPLETLMGSKLTVEDSLDALNEIQKTRQPKTLEVPIEMLSGTKLTVETALGGINDVINGDVDECSSFPTGATVNATYGNHIILRGRTVQLNLNLEGVTQTQFARIATIPTRYRPPYDFLFPDTRETNRFYKITASGNIETIAELSNKQVCLNCCWNI